jgi:hypothetical protein
MNQFTLALAITSNPGLEMIPVIFSLLGQARMSHSKEWMEQEALPANA